MSLTVKTPKTITKVDAGGRMGSISVLSSMLRLRRHCQFARDRLAHECLKG